MAYTRRRSTARRHRRKAFSKRQVKAIQSIATKPVETKHFPFFGTLASFAAAASYSAGANMILCRNIYAGISRSTNQQSDSLISSEHSFIGNEIMSRGFRWEFKAFAYSSTPGAQLDVQFRYTCFSVGDYYGAATFGISPTNGAIFDLDHGTTPTWSKWNTQGISIHLQRSFRLDNNGNQNSIVNRKFYVPLRRKITSALDRDVADNSDQMFQIKNNQVYWALEVFAPGFPDEGNLTAYLNGQIDTAIYFKDA